MGDVWISLVVGLLRGVAFLCDVITYIPWCLYDPPGRKVALSRRIKAKPSREGDPSSPYRAIESFDPHHVSSFPKVATLDEAFEHAVRAYGVQPCLGTRELLEEMDEVQLNGKIFKKDVLGAYEWQSYAEVHARVLHLAHGLRTLGLEPRTSNVCIFADTRAEWMISALACFKSNLPVMTLYATLGDEALVHGINETKVAVIITTIDLLPKFSKLVSRIPHVKHLVHMSPANKNVALPNVNSFSASGISVHSISALEAVGAKAAPSSNNDVKLKSRPDDVAVIMYTSGSTGLPKGVMISHCNLLSGMAGQSVRVPNLGPKDCYIGYLPLAHVLELDAEMVCIIYGTPIGFSSPNTLTDQSTRIKRGCKGDATVLRPTLMAAVPVIMDRIRKGILDKMTEGSPWLSALFDFAYEYKARHYAAGFETPLLDKFIFKKTRRMLGGRIRAILSGGAPLSADTQRFMNVCFCCPVGQGYGLTETCGAGTVHEGTDRSTGRVGAPLLCNEIKLVNWEEGGYTTADRPFPRGEVWIGGANIVLGYFGDAEKTKEEFHEDERGQRWFSTGDIGMFYPDGCLKIIDRKKDLVKLAGGEYVALGRVEAVLKLCPLVDNICVCADSASMFVVCLVVPNQKHLRALADSLGGDAGIGAAGEGIKGSAGGEGGSSGSVGGAGFSRQYSEGGLRSWRDICTDGAVVKAALASIQQYGAKGKLERSEIPQALRLCSDSWTPDMGLITESYKLKRKAIETFYANDIRAMYAGK